MGQPGEFNGPCRAGDLDGCGGLTVRVQGTELEGGSGGLPCPGVAADENVPARERLDMGVAEGPCLGGAADALAADGGEEAATDDLRRKEGPDFVDVPAIEEGAEQGGPAFGPGGEDAALAEGAEELAQVETVGRGRIALDELRAAPGE